MNETIKQILVAAAPIVAGFITSIIIPLSIKKVVLKRLQKRVDEVNSGTEFKELKKEVIEIKEMLLKIRGKRK